MLALLRAVYQTTAAYLSETVLSTILHFKKTNCRIHKECDSSLLLTENEIENIKQRFENLSEILFEIYISVIFLCVLVDNLFISEL